MCFCLTTILDNKICKCWDEKDEIGYRKLLSMFNKLSLSGDRLARVLAGPWSMKLFYLGYFSAMGVYLPYLGLYLEPLDSLALR